MDLDVRNMFWDFRSEIEVLEIGPKIQKSTSSKQLDAYLHEQWHCKSIANDHWTFKVTIVASLTVLLQML